MLHLSLPPPPLSLSLSLSLSLFLSLSPSLALAGKIYSIAAHYETCVKYIFKVICKLITIIEKYTKLKAEWQSSSSYCHCSFAVKIHHSKSLSCLFFIFMFVYIYLRSFLSSLMSSVLTEQSYISPCQYTASTISKLRSSNDWSSSLSRVFTGI